MSGGQVVTGLDVGGDISFELARGSFFDDFFEAGLMGTWAAASTAVAATFTPDGTDDQKGVIAGTGSTTGLAVGDVVILVDGTSGDKGLFTVITITDADTMTVASKRGQAASTGMSSRPSYVDIGAVQNSFTTSKSYKDVSHLATTDNHGQVYSGTLVSGFSVDASYGSIVTGSFNLVGNGYDQTTGPSYEQQVVAGGGTVNPAGTSQSLNASIDVPVLTVGGVASTWCAESLSLSLDNGLTPQNCLGKIAATKYELGTASISIDLSVYNSDSAFDDLMPAKLTQVPVSMVITMMNADGGYAFAFSALQLSGNDPSAGGANSPVMLDMSGVARVGVNQESALRVYRL